MNYSENSHDMHACLGNGRGYFHPLGCRAAALRLTPDYPAAVGFPVALDYPLSGILSVLAGPGGAAFKPLVAKLAAWRDDLRAMAT